MKEKNIAVEILKKLMAEQVSLYKRTNVVQSQKFSEKIAQLMNSYYNGLITNEEVIKELCTIKGVGPWTAEMFLIFALRRPDVAPMLDYGFIKAVGQAYFPEIAF